MSFDRLAPFYRAMEFLSAGRRLQRCREAWLEAVPMPRAILLAGEGHGKSLEACMRRFPEAALTAVDASAGMLREARSRLRRAGLDDGRVRFLQADLLTWEPPPGEYDLIVTHFFLDCFSAESLARVVSRLAGAAAPEAHWLLADFQIARRGVARWRSQVIVGMLYRFFRVVTRLPASSLVCPAPCLESEGFHLHHRRDMEWGLLTSQWWRRDAGRAVGPGEMRSGQARLHDSTTPARHNPDISPSPRIHDPS